MAKKAKRGLKKKRQIRVPRIWARLWYKQGKGPGSMLEIRKRHPHGRIGEYIGALTYDKGDWQVTDSMLRKYFGWGVFEDGLQDARHLFPNG